MAGMKNCKSCGKEIAKSAKVCPNCGAKQGGIGKIIGIVVVVLVILGIIGAVAGGGKDEKKSAIDNSEAKTETTSKDDKKSEDGEETSDEGDEEFVKVGGSYDNNGLKFTVDDADLKFKIKDDEYGMYDLDEGLHYIKVDFTFENTGDSGDKYVSIYDFDCYADNRACEQQYVSSVTGDFINTNLSPGRNTSFSTLYAVPDGVKEIELEYTANIWTDEKVIVKLK